jgi:asparagine synthase (glutamine-hydrolysing)
VCAITGQYKPDGCISREILTAMRDTMTHRGPDDAGLYINPESTVGLGHRRLSIIDLSPAGHQPMTNEDGTVWLVFNGEIYNFMELRTELVRAGHVFRSSTDSEVIIHGYEEWGPDCIRRLRGMFAIALWDASRRRLLLARDRLGIKPLFYHFREGNLTFASELKALRANPEINLQLDDSAVYDYFTYRYVPTPKTIYRDIRKLPPASYAVLENGKLSMEQYWEPAFNSNGNISLEDATELVRQKLAEAVNLHLIADVPVGILLSGGLDSSSLLAFAAGAASQPLHTFTIGFDVEQHSEARVAARIADLYRSQHHELTVTRATAQEMEDRVIDLYDEPFADSSAIPTLIVSGLARENVKVALSGEGGDEIFGGYGWYALWWKMRHADAIPRTLRRLAAAPMKLAPTGFKGKWSLEAAALGPLERYARFISAFSRQDKQGLLSGQFLGQFDGYDDLWYFRKYWREDLDPFSRMQYLDLKTYLNDDILTKMDRASMAVSLEARVPLLDHVLIDTVYSLPAAIRNHNGRQKYLFRKTIAGMLPDDILNGRKRGFSIPLYEWLKSPDLDLLEPVLDNRYMSPAALSSGRLTGSDLWPFLVMGKWLRMHA